MLSEACRCGGLPAVCRFSAADLTADVKTEISPLFCFRQALRLILPERLFLYCLKQVLCSLSVRFSEA